MPGIFAGLSSLKIVDKKFCVSFCLQDILETVLSVVTQNVFDDVADDETRPKGFCDEVDGLGFVSSVVVRVRRSRHPLVP